jgi:hypothetical protein
MSNTDTESQYQQLISKTKEIFNLKNKDYGASWLVFRLPSLTDQIFIKVKRIRSIQESGENKVGDSIDSEFLAIINYCLMAIILSDKQMNELLQQDASEANLIACYDSAVALCFETMKAKNHDYGEAWRDMRVSSFFDLMLVKLLRIKQIEENNGQTNISEGPVPNYIDILNYSIFALIQRNYLADNSK